MGLKDMLKRLVLKEKANPEAYLAFLKSLGVSIGEGTRLFAGPTHVCIDTQNPHLLTIGRNVQITDGVTILTHDYSWSVIKGVHGEVLGNQAPVTIGDNVFIGMQAVILGGTTIGDNVIIGANSTVKGCIPSNCVAAGSPARPVCTLEEFYEKRKSKQLEEAFEVYRRYQSRFAKRPPKEQFREYFWLFEGSGSDIGSVFDEVNSYVDPVLTRKVFESHSPMFEGYEAFECYCLDRIDHEGEKA